MKINNRTLSAGFFCCLWGIFFAYFESVAAQEMSPEGPVALELLVETDAGGWTPVALDTPGQAPPGRLIMVSTRFRVPAEAGAEAQMLTLAVPDWLTYQLGSAVGPGSQALLSFNNGLSFGKDPGAGKSAEYAGARATHVRWIFTRRLSPGAQGQVRYRAIRRPDSRAGGVAQPPDDSETGQGKAN